MKLLNEKFSLSNGNGHLCLVKGNGGMPVIECWNGGVSIVLKRSMATGYAGVQNPLFFLENTRMLFGDASETLDKVFKAL